MTIQYYQDNADAFFNGTVDVDMENIYQQFTKYLSPNAQILDAGCGSGRDSMAFVNMGYTVDAFDASSKLTERARQYTRLDVKHMVFNDVNAIDKYDGIWCCASLLHVKSKELPNTMQILSRALKLNGVWYVSFKYGVTDRHKDRRNFTDMDEAKLEKLIRHIEGVVIKKMWITSDNRPEREEMWLNAILLKN